MSARVSVTRVRRKWDRLHIFIHFPKFGHPHGRPGGLSGSCLPPSGLPWPAKNSVVLHFLRKKVTFFGKYNVSTPPWKWSSTLCTGEPHYMRHRDRKISLGYDKFAYKRTKDDYEWIQGRFPQKSIFSITLMQKCRWKDRVSQGSPVHQILTKWHG